MPTPAETLREIHRLRRYAKDLQTKIDEVPRRLKILQDRTAFQEEHWRQAQEQIKKLKVRVKDDEGTLKATAEQIKKYEHQQGGILSKKEYDALQHEIAHARQKISQLEDQILQNLAEVDEQTRKLPEQEQALARGREELIQFQKDSDARKADLANELAKTQQQLAVVESELPTGDLRAQYERLLRQRGDDAFSPVRGRSCTACYNEVTSQMANELAQGRFVLCKSCGRILYLME